MGRELNGAWERLDVAAESPAREMAAVFTTLKVERWDEEQTRWARGVLELPGFIDLTPVHFARAGQGGVRPYLVTEDVNCNAIVSAGWTALLGGVAGTTITNKFSATNGRVGVGTSTTAVAWGDTALGGDTGAASTTSYYKLVSTAPSTTIGSGPATLVFTATFGTGVANFAWQEFGTDNYTTDGVTTTGLGAGFIFFNHGISNQGTKVSGQTWTATETLTFGYPHALGQVGAVS